MSMIERVAKRMFEEWLAEPDTVRDQAKNGPHPEWEAQSEIGRRRWLNYARAAIEAMRVPTDELHAAAEEISVYYDDFSCGDGNVTLGLPGYRAKFNDVWSSLIDAALKESECPNHP
jgi:hypothetical protein